MLKVENLRTVFETRDGVFTAVHDLSFTVGRGETVGIVGESGSGKSVTSLSLMRLIAAPPGRIENGKAVLETKSGAVVDLLALSPGELRKMRGNEIAMIFQEPMTSLNPVYTVGEQVAEAIRIHQPVLSAKAVKEQVIALFNKVKLPRPESLYNSYPHELSGGQKQRVMIAMAISCNPRILIADEPTTALDVTVQASILELLRELQKETGMGLIFITHDLGVMAEIADRVLVMYKGRLVEQGSVKELFSNPQHPYTKGLLSCRPAGYTGIQRLPVISDFMRENQDGSYEETGQTIAKLIDQLKAPADRVAARRSALYRQEPLLRVERLSVHFQGKKGWFSRKTESVKAVDDVSFEVYPGETLGLVGESGCGKTTLGRSILRLIEPTSGSIHYGGKQLLDLDTSAMRLMRRQMQLIFQDPYSSLNPRMTAGAAILEPMQVHGLYGTDQERRRKVVELLEKVGLSEAHYNRYPHQFSGGQRQRICIARALSLNPSFVICDESVSALDVSVQAQVLNLLNQLKEEQGLTYIFISHDLSVVRYMSDRMLVMNKGRIEEMGDADEVYSNPQSAYTRKLIDSIPKFTV